MQKKLAYYGCGDRTGHYFFGLSTTNKSYAAQDFPGTNRRIFEMIDGSFTPGDTNEQGLYQVNIVPPVMIVSWHDYSMDYRPGSNSNLIGMGYESAEEMIDDALVKFPYIMARQPRPIPNIKPSHS